MKTIAILILLALPGCTAFHGFKGEVTVKHKSGWEVSGGYSK